MKDLKLNTDPGPEPEPPKPEPVVFLQNTYFWKDGTGNDYSVEVTSEGVIVYSECCADIMSRETAKLVWRAIGNYLAMTA